MKWAVVGSRGFTASEVMATVLNQARKEHGEPSLIITGGAKGADTMAAQWADVLGFPVEIHKADWDKFGKKAGALRNRKIVARADRVFAFCTGTRLTPGTSITIRLARAKGLPIDIHYSDQ